MMKIWRYLEDEEDVKMYGIKLDTHECLGSFVHPVTLQPMAMFRKTSDPFPNPEDNDIFIVPMKTT